MLMPLPQEQGKKGMKVAVGKIACPGHCTPPAGENAADKNRDRVPKMDIAYRDGRKHFEVRLALPMSI